MVGFQSNRAGRGLVQKIRRNDSLWSGRAAENVSYCGAGAFRRGGRLASAKKRPHRVRFVGPSFSWPFFVMQFAVWRSSGPARIFPRAAEPQPRIARINGPQRPEERGEETGKRKTEKSLTEKYCFRFPGEQR